MKWLVGIDEVGRGPLAGPVTLGLFMTSSNKKLPIWKILKKAKDSKALSEKQRNEWFKKIKILAKGGEIKFFTSSVGNKIIDKIGIAGAVRLAIKRVVKKTELKPTNCEILLDGSLRAPSKFKNQKTIIKGDEKKPIIALASIVAKVRRDKRMRKLAKIYPRYHFEENVGYGTAEHIKALKKWGFSTIHRRSFIGGILKLT